ncbi:hypothetical protein I6H88_15145 [Elizabethkingia bruuniana]|uniref:Uncharacterized protein n=1 Tax=Elizabethkingia bruuniana TaxID=1756149 RepID=A0A7T7UX19_9FLAO|nr:DUF5829 family protein [Elizabethkingia bruuniana]KGO08105.1 hypothetical protein KS04_22250 [Elizabethkingia miricola]AQX84334.1 hypothetical protein AYC65_04550 [Elizabethkingia bruuniana]KUY27788.1 hypothetical protein ATB97_16550 [Elizabethkingia bruuniana]OPB64751.1 hypothetical protein BAY12_08190 [Elizabethkingia bruuniana]QQN57769.1 hypothetical protein I6H88_15145 [Elizabethkingia bruuniana]
MNKIFSLLILFVSMALSGQKSGGNSDLKDLKVNHIYVVVDSTTFNALKQSNELNTLANQDKGLPNFLPLDNSATTIYMRFKSTYLEIMGPENRFKEKIGSIGIGFSWDTFNSTLDTVQKSIQKSKDLKFQKSEANWPFGGKEILWYTFFYSDFKGSIATWYAIYNPVFLNYLFNINYSDFKREDFLKKVFDQNKKIIDLSGIVINANANDFYKMIKEFKALNIKIKKQKPRLVIYKLDSVTIELKLTERRNSMIKELRFISKGETRLNINLGNIHIKNSTSNQISMTFE